MWEAEKGPSTTLSASVLSPLHTEYRGVFTTELQLAVVWQGARHAGATAALGKGAAQGSPPPCSTASPSISPTHKQGPTELLGRDFLFCREWTLPCAPPSQHPSTLGP